MLKIIGLIKSLNEDYLVLVLEIFNIGGFIGDNRSNEGSKWSFVCFVEDV